MDIRSSKILTCTLASSGILILNACVAPNFDIQPGSYKTGPGYSRDKNICLQIANDSIRRYMGKDTDIIRERIYVECMLDRGNDVVLKPTASEKARDWVQAAREQAAREQAAREQAAREQAAREQAAREQAAREPQIGSPSLNGQMVAVSRFGDIIGTCQKWISKAAHPLGKSDEINIQLVRVNPNNAIFVEDVTWHFGNNNYQTRIEFNISYSVPDLIDSITIEAMDANHPNSPAFFGIEATKYALFHLLADKLKDERHRYASIFVKTLNSSTSAKGFISEILRIMANDKSSDGCKSWPQV